MACMDVTPCAVERTRVARVFGVGRNLRLIPFKGLYRKLRAEKSHLVRGSFYPVLDIRNPFLGVHFTRRVGGEIEAGPNAVLALKREGYRKSDFSAADLMDAVAEYLSLPPIQVYEVASFYSMFETKPCGRHHVSVCTNICCMLRGGEQLLAHVEKRLGIAVGESTPDGKFYLKKEEECLAACTGAPMMMVDHKFHEKLTPARVDEILDSLE